MTLTKSIATAGLAAGAYLFLAPSLCMAETALLEVNKGSSQYREIHFEIHSQPMEGALRDFASQADLQLIYTTDDVDSEMESSGLVGTFSAPAALSRLLAHTSLYYKFVNLRTVAIRGVRQLTNGPKNKANSESREDPHAADPAPGPRPAEASGSLSDLATGPLPDVAEVIVTAEKRAERLQDVPVPVTALSASALTENNQNRLQDYFSSVPGLSFNTAGSGDANLSIRGVTTGGNTNSTVAITIDDIPIGATSAITNNNTYVPDLDPSDLQRIEVLRGPQGTLYGASSIGGLVKYVTVDPSVDQLTGRVEVTGSGLHNGNTVGYGVRGAANLPVSDTLAFRVSGFTRGDPGYFDNPVRGVDGLNRERVAGGRVSSLWRPADNLTVKLAALLQYSTMDGLAAASPGLGDLQQNVIPGGGHHTAHVQIYSANITSKLGPVDLTSVTGYSINNISTNTDLSYAYGGLAEQYFGVSGASITYNVDTKKFSQELRLSSTIGDRFDWLLGGFYTHEQNPVDGPVPAQDPLTGQAVGTVARFTFPSTFAEIAGFVDFTVHFTDQFDVQLGAREGHNRQIYSETDTGPVIPIFFGQPSPLVVPTQHSADSSFTYLVTPRFRLNPHLMVYSRLASGYRPGGPNPDAVLFGYPDRFKADKTKNYEIGTKGDLFDRRFSFDASIYYIRWNDIQISVYDPTSGFAFFENAGSAKSQGAELALQLQPARGLSISTWFAYNDAKLTSDLPAGATATGLSGDRLPFSSRYSANLSLEQEAPLGGVLTGFVRGALNYVGDRKSEFAGTEADRLTMPGYVVEDLLFGVRGGPWSINAFLNNISDRRGVVSRPNANGEFGYAYIRPRTVGVSLSRTF